MLITNKEAEAKLKFTLRALRINKNMTQTEIAKIVGVSKYIIGKWERGEAYPDAIQIKKLEKFFDVGFDEIIFLPRNDDISV